MICSADGGTLGELGRWFAEGTVRKRYLALVVGHAPEDGMIDRPLMDRRRRRHLAAVTDFERREAFGEPGRCWSLLAVSPKTGRRHQIRRHLRGIGHPIVGGERHGPPYVTDVPGFPGRLWLHLEQLELPDGTCLTSPLSRTLRRHLSLLRNPG